MNDAQLLLYYYDDGLSAQEREAIRVAIERDELVAARYRRLEKDLAALAAEPGERVPEDLRQRLHAAVDRAADLERGREVRRPARSHWSSFLLGAGLAAALAAAVGLGLRQAGTPAPPDLTPMADAGTVAEEPEPAFERAMQVYFRDSSLELQDLPDAGNGERTELIMQLIKQNRAFARLAVDNRAPDLARVLRAFEPILTRLAAHDITAEESEQLRAKLAFELNVMLTKLTREASEYVTPTEQET
jgi:hypothetical protein